MEYSKRDKVEKKSNHPNCNCSFLKLKVALPNGTGRSNLKKF
jgi:hypothetical protein